MTNTNLHAAILAEINTTPSQLVHPEFRAHLAERIREVVERSTNVGDDELRAKIIREFLPALARWNVMDTDCAARLADIAMRYVKQARSAESAFDEAGAQKETP